MNIIKKITSSSSKQASNTMDNVVQELELNNGRIID